MATGSDLSFCKVLQKPKPPADHRLLAVNIYLHANEAGLESNFGLLDVRFSKEQDL